MNKEALEQFIRDNTRFTNIVHSKDGVHLDSLFIIDLENLDIDFLVERNTLSFDLLEELRTICLEIQDNYTLSLYNYWDEIYALKNVYHNGTDNNWILVMGNFQYEVVTKISNEYVSLQEIDENGYLKYCEDNGFKLKFL